MGFCVDISFQLFLVNIKEFVLLLHFVVIVMVWCWFCCVASFVVGCCFLVSFDICFCIVVCLWYVLCVLSAASIVGIVCSRCKAGVDAAP